jgi:hypothetical protein
MDDLRSGLEATVRNNESQKNHQTDGGISGKELINKGKE